MKFIICTGSYNENVGGSIVPHKLCEYINKHTDSDCYLHLLYQYPILRKGNIISSFLSAVKIEIASKIKNINSTDANRQYILKKIPSNLDDYIVIYLEAATDNPLNARNVVRLLLHNPGHFTGLIHYGVGELYFRYGPHFGDFQITGSKTSDVFIHIQVYPTDLYNLLDVKERVGSCYALRKGKARQITHEIKGSQLIDNLSHSEIATLFKKSEFFISYDTETAYSYLAALCGCISIVVPEEGVHKDMWQPDESLRYGVAYGFSKDELNWAKNTQQLLIDRVNDVHRRNIIITKDFVNECQTFFKG